MTDKKLINESLEGESMTDFLPTNYDIPSSQSNYMKFEQGKNRFRVLSSTIIGNEFWVTVDEGRKPIRRRVDETILTSELEDEGMIKHFWAFIVWNYQDEAVQILEITQKTIMRGIKDLTSDEDWGDPKDYDITITRTGEKLETEYTVKPHPSKELDEGIKDIYDATNINLEALFDGADPFAEKE